MLLSNTCGLHADCNYDAGKQYLLFHGFEIKLTNDCKRMLQNVKKRREKELAVNSQRHEIPFFIAFSLFHFSPMMKIANTPNGIISRVSSRHVYHKPKPFSMDLLCYDTRTN